MSNNKETFSSIEEEIRGLLATHTPHQGSLRESIRKLENTYSFQDVHSEVVRMLDDGELALGPGFEFKPGKLPLSDAKIGNAITLYVSVCEHPTRAAIIEHVVRQGFGTDIAAGKAFSRLRDESLLLPVWSHKQVAWGYYVSEHIPRDTKDKEVVEDDEPEEWPFVWSTLTKGDDTKALRHNQGKPELARIRQFGVALEQLAAVQAYGAGKYSDFNFLKGGKPDAEYMDALDRHMLAFYGGEQYDSESNCLHLAHAAWNILAMMRLNYSNLPPTKEDHA
jgi:hypothetical protein